MDAKEQPKEEAPREVKRRPYWHVDMKWVAGLLLLSVLGWWLLILSAYKITAPNTGVALVTNILAYNFSRNGLDDSAGFDELKAKILRSPTKSIQPIAGFPVTITLHDVTALSPRDLRLKIFGQIAKPLYYKGAAEYAKEITNDPVQQKKFENDASIFSLVTQDRHNSLGKLAVWVSVLALILLVALVYFSAGFGRLVSPALVLFMISLPGLAIFSGLRSWTEKAAVTTSGQSEDIGALLDATKGAFTGAFTAAQKIYLFAFVAAAVLLMVALVGKIAVRLRAGLVRKLTA